MARGLTWNQDIDDVDSADRYTPVAQVRPLLPPSFDCDPWANDIGHNAYTKGD